MTWMDRFVFSQMIRYGFRACSPANRSTYVASSTPMARKCCAMSRLNRSRSFNQSRSLVVVVDVVIVVVVVDKLVKVVVVVVALLGRKSDANSTTALRRAASSLHCVSESTSCARVVASCVASRSRSASLRANRPAMPFSAPASRSSDVATCAPARSRQTSASTRRRLSNFG